MKCGTFCKMSVSVPKAQDGVFKSLVLSTKEQERNDICRLFGQRKTVLSNLRFYIYIDIN